MPMADCNGCGACCEPYAMMYSPADIDRLAARIDPDELAFMREHLTPMKRRDGRRMAPWNSGFTEFVDADGHPQLIASHYYKCDRYDPVAKVCTDYDNRPDVCRGFPWYGRGPDPSRLLPPTCSYRTDIGQPVEPVPVAAPTRRVPAVPRSADRGS